MMQSRGGSLHLLFATAYLLLTPAALLPGQELPLLVPTRTTPLSGPIGSSPMFTIPAECDEDGNIYFHVFETNYVTKVPADGRVGKKFNLDTVPDSAVKGVRKSSIASYTADARGNVYEIVRNDEGKAFIIEFDDDGKFQGMIELKVPDFEPYRLSAFPTGDLLISGYVMQNENNTNVKSAAAFTAIFDPTGRLVSTLVLPDDISGKKLKSEPLTHAASPQTDSSAVEHVNSNLEVATAIGTGTAAIGPDGNAYLFRNSHSPMVYVISPSGEVIRHMVLEPPAPDIWPMTESMSGSRVAVVFGTRADSRKHQMAQPQIYSVYDAMSGDHLYDYKGSPKLNGAFGCYTQNAFLFVGMQQDGKMTLIQAQPR